MKKIRLINAGFLLVSILFLETSLARNDNPLDLPEGAIARLGKGLIVEGDRAVAWSPDGTRLAVASGLGIWIHDANTGAEIALLRREWVSAVAFSPDGTTLASVSRSGLVEVWDGSSGQLKATMWSEVDLHGGSAVAFSPDGTTLAGASLLRVDGSQEDPAVVQLWDIDTQGLNSTLEGHTDVVESVAFSPDGGTLVSGGRDGAVRLWDVATGKPKETLEGHTDVVESVAFSPDGGTLASGSRDGTIRFWDVSGGQPKATLEGHTDVVGSVAFSADGGTLASASWNGQIWFWSTDTGQLETTAQKDEGYVRELYT